MRRSRLATTLVALPIIALLVGLGTWQLQRLAWKEDLIAAMEARRAGAPVPLDQALSLAPADREWRRVMATGRLLNDRQVAMYRLSVDGKAGYHLLVPLELADGRHVLVDRGFVPEANIDPATRPGSEPRGEVWVVGVLRPGETPGPFTPDNDPASDAWYWLDLGALGDDMGVDLLPVVIYADAEPGDVLPRGGQAVFDPPNDHLQYALTWYGLAVVALVIYLLLLRKRPPDRRART